MKKRMALRNGAAALAALVWLGGVFLSGCEQILFERPESRSLPAGMGLLSVSLSGPRQAGSGSARTMLSQDPELSSYELYISQHPDGSDPATYTSGAGSFQITLINGDYYISAAGYSGDKVSARTWNLETETPVITPLHVSGHTTTSLTLRPYMDDSIPGTLQYSLNWDGVGQIPARAELLVEQYDSTGDSWNAIPISLITSEGLTAGAQRGTILLIQRETGLVKQSGSLDLPPGEYRLTTSVAMDGPNPPVSRADIAHVFSNLTTPAAFVYHAGDLTVTNPGTDPGAGFITGFTFSQTPGAVSIIGSSPGPDGARLIMVMVPDSSANLTSLTPLVDCAPGARIVSSPYPPVPGPDGKPVWIPGDYSRPTSWVAEGRNGVTQPYTVIVTRGAEDTCLITNIAFQETGLESAPIINHTANPATIEVVVPSGTKDKPGIGVAYSLTPVFSYIGTKVMRVDPDHESEDTYDIPLTGGKIEFYPGGTPAKFRVYASSGGHKLYTVTITEAASGDAAITNFVLDGYPDYPFTVAASPSGDYYAISNTANKLPYGTPLTSLKPLITYQGNLNPGSGVEQNFSVPVYYTVISDNETVTKPYKVVVATEDADTDTGIFDFVITNVPRAKVVIGTKPRADGKIPIVVQVPYATSPLTLIDSEGPVDGPKWTDLKALIAQITLSDRTGGQFLNPDDDTQITAPDGVLTGTIPFDNQDNYQEAVYRIRAQAGNFQDYVVVVARDVHYYYVKATGDDTDPDQYNGGSESTPFKTLAHAVYQAVEHNVDHIYVIGTLNNASEGGAWENTSTAQRGAQDGNGQFHNSGASPVAGGQSVFNIRGTGRNGSNPWRIYITGIGSNAALEGTANKRVIAITGGAHITFENITIRNGGGGAAYGANGGGIYIGEGSTVIWKSGSITGSRALSGGGVYVDNSEFDLMTGSVSGNTASGTTATNFTTGTNPVIQGGGGVYVFGEEGLFWLVNGEVSGNSAAGSGGGVLVNGAPVPDHTFIMNGGKVNNNTSSGNFWPHGGGGVFVAKGAFEMLNGQIMNNTSLRQGGGVFVWSRALFYMDGDSSVTANTGVGSSKAICSRGVTTLRGNAQADKVYIWNYAAGNWGNGQGDEFTMMEGARVSGLVLAFADDPQNNRNYINIVQSDRLPDGQFFSPGTAPITTIDLESRLLSSGAFDPNATIAGDWLGKYLIKDGGNEIPPAQAAALIKRFPLGSYTYGGSRPVSLSAYTLDTFGKLAAKP
ncbi:MAG: hypothetical protein LBK27_02065 [Treponema sp.]|jgi:hypothetical protein|nr:hypothetical protein [Treponema sp.]